MPTCAAVGRRPPSQNLPINALSDVNLVGGSFFSAGMVERYHPELHYMRGPGPKWCMDKSARQIPQNRLLAYLKAADYQRLSEHLEEVPLAYRMPLSRANVPIECVYFLEDGVASIGSRAFRQNSRRRVIRSRPSGSDSLITARARA
jgi:hypothetical protein